MLRITNRKQVYLYASGITLIAVAAPVCVVGGILIAIPGMPKIAIAVGLAMAFFVPLLIAPPIALLGLNLLRIMNEAIDKVDNQIRFDTLTAVLNRGHFLDQVRAHHSDGIMLIVDADHFKRINDTFGHAAGDGALITLAHTVQQTVGLSGLVGRLGGEEFGVFLPNVDMRAGRMAAEAICDTVSELQLVIGGQAIPLTVSIGCSHHDPRMSIGHSLKNADRHLYEAKSAGRNRVICEALGTASSQQNDERRRA